MLSDPHFPDEFDPSSSILFLGSGFSTEATNIENGHPPAGKGLAMEILRRLHMPEDSDYDIKDLSTHAQGKDVDLYALLTNLFTIKSLTDEQRSILSLKWRRIYTTNYDDAVELYQNELRSSPRLEPRSFEDPLPAKILPGTIVHLHGFIHRCTRENVLSQLVLNHRSYAEQHAKGSPWWGLFERDIRTAEAIFFVGYSLGDFAVASYLTTNPELSKKCYFIVQSNPDPIMISRLSGYGALHPIAVTGFAGKCRSLRPARVLSHPNALAAFRYFDPYKDNKAPSKPTTPEIDALMTFGNFKLQRLLSTFPEPLYVVPRIGDVDRAVDFLATNKTLIIHSKIGNGKSIFRHCLSIRLSEFGYNCFECRDDVTIPEQELDFIGAQNKPVIIFPNIDTAYITREQLTGLPKGVRFIVEMNTGTLQVRRAEVHNRLQGPIERLDLNKFSRTDVDHLEDLLRGAGFPSQNIKSRFGDHPEIRDIVLSLYSNDQVSRRIRDLLSPMLSDPDFKRILYCSVILKSQDLKVDPGFLRAVTGIDAYSAIAKFSESALEIMSFDLDRVEPHSSIFSEYMIREHFNAHDLIDWVYKLCAEAARRMHEEGNPESARSRDARHTLGTLLTYSQLADFLKQRSDRDNLVEDLYERGRSNVHINAEPLFWLQYSIFMQSKGNWPLAEKHMQTAYERADLRAGFKTYQLDTNSFGLYLELEKNDLKSTSVSRFEAIVERLERLGDMLSDGNHRGHALRVLIGIEEFLRIRSGALSTSEAVRLTYHLHLLIDKLDAYDIQLRVEMGSDATKESLKRSLGLLLKLS